MLHSEFSTIKTLFLFDKNLNGTEIKLLWVISSLSKSGIGCFAGNGYLANCMNMNKTSVSDILTKLEKEKYIFRKSINDPETNKTTTRLIFINHEKNIEIPDFLKETEEVPPLRKIPNTHSENSETYMYSNTLNGNNTTSNMYSVLESSIVPILEKDEDFKNLDNNQKQSAMYIVQEMVKVYQRKNPDYFFDKETDYHACLQIVYKIAQMKKWGKMEALEGKMKECLSSWDKITDFIVNDKWLITRSLSDISTVKEWQRLVNGMNAEKKSKPKISDYEKNRQEQLEKYRNKTTVPQ